MVTHALSTLAARKYSSVFFDFPVSEAALSRIQPFTLVKPDAATCTEEESWVQEGNKVTLSFNGGFDSLSALALMPKNTSLVSMDYGGNFGRERSGFLPFNPIVVETNIAETSLRSGSWSFMGIGAILTSRYTKSRFLTFGGILDQSPQAFYKPSPLLKNSTVPAFSACGYHNAPYVIGITEASTAKIIAKTFPEDAVRSLHSVAQPGTEKLRENMHFLRITYHPSFRFRT